MHTSKLFIDKKQIFVPCFCQLVEMVFMEEIRQKVDG